MMNFTQLFTSGLGRSFTLLITSLLASCTKTDVLFGDDGNEGDPNISYYDNYEVSLATYQTDSFQTSGNNVFALGHHADTSFGTITGGSFAEVQLPANNPVDGQQVLFDSLVLLLKPNGNYYGDTLQPLKLLVHRLTQRIENDDEDDVKFYNPRRFNYDPAPIGQRTVIVRPRRGTEISVRLSDALGQDLLKKFRTNNDTITDQEEFIKYFKGLYIEADSNVSRSLYYFTTGASGALLRIHYRLLGTFTQSRYFDLPVNRSKQFNNIGYHHAGTPLNAFTPFKKQLKKSSATGNKAYLNSNMGTYIKISFPSLLNLKETYPFIKVIKAELVIKPAQVNYRYPYSLPGSMYLYATDDGNGLNNVFADATGRNPQTGDLIVDDLHKERTQYSYDITGFVGSVIEEGRFSKSALMLVPSTGITDNSIQRLLLYDAPSNKSVQLKLYVLGL